jgi:hypothetical protein
VRCFDGSGHVKAQTELVEDTDQDGRRWSFVFDFIKLSFLRGYPQVP